MAAPPRAFMLYALNQGFMEWQKPDPEIRAGLTTAELKTVQDAACQSDIAFFDGLLR